MKKLSREARQTWTFVSIAFLPVLLIRLIEEKIVYLTRYLAAFPGDLLLSLFMFFAKLAIRETQVKAWYNSLTYKIFLGGAGFVFGHLQMQSAINDHYHPEEVARLWSERYHSYVTFPAGFIVVGTLLMPLITSKLSWAKVIALAFLAGYLSLFILDKFINGKPIVNMEEWHVGILLDLRK